MTTNNNNQQPAAGNVAAELAAATIGCRVSFTWIGQTKKIDGEQQAEAAAVFGANAEAVTMSKRLFDTKNEQYRNVTAVRSAIKRFWNNETLPFTEPGVRLLRRENAAEFARKMVGFAADLAGSVRELDNVFGQLKAEAAERLGELFDGSDYPDSLAGEFGVKFDFPNLAPPEYLATLSPELYQRESRRVAAQFEQAAELAESAFLAELATMVERVTETLTTADNGKPRIFRDTLISNFNAFFGRFRSLSIGSSSELVALVERAQNALASVSPAALRTDSILRESVRRNMASVSNALTAEASRPARRIRFNAAEPATVEPVPVPVQSEAEAEPLEPAAVADQFPAAVAAVVSAIEAAEPSTLAEAEAAAVAAVVSDQFPAAIEAAEAEAVDAIGETLAETLAEAEPLEPATVEPVQPIEPPAVAPVQAEPEPATVEPVQPAAIAERERITFSLNYGGGRVETLTVSA